ncbi:aldehyde dehydrogenase family protein [Ochrovirga pacifica]|uniref:aldehyde dehydrogenase family protein n=1 Tax=Ochrovirga pacifica TaxID=1042376 RepID=UPI0002559231|nr:aldehyde dehydrogenase family protein [Ochrovirga pacifica]
MSNLLFGHKNLYINGELKPASNNGVFDVISPATEKSIGTIAWATKQDTLKALETAEQGFHYWSQLSIEDRNQWIHKLRNKIVENSDLLREAIMNEMGKTWEASEEDVELLIKSLEFYADEIHNRNPEEIADKEGTHSHKIVAKPLGVAVAFLAYNFPLLNLGYKLGPALAAGCSIVLKPSEFSPISAYIIGEIAKEINFPKGVITVLCGDLENVGIPLCESTIPQLITMIGSAGTAQKLMEQSSKTSIKRYSMECGGNAPFIVCEDADLDTAINIGSILKTSNSGQICVAPNRYFVHQSVLDAFVAGVKAKFEKTKIGFGRDNKPDMGPLANKQSVAKVKEIVNRAIAQGGKLITGGKEIEGDGYYFEPTIILFDKPYADIMEEEIFGPVVIAVPFTDKAEVLKLANNVDAGLSSFVFSKSNETIQYFAQNLDFGEIQVNGVKYDIYLPHVGVKNAGVSMDCSKYALDDYLSKRRITIKL